MNIKWEKGMLILMLAALTMMSTSSVMASSGNVWPADSQGNQKYEFNVFVDNVYVMGNGLPANTEITIYIMDPQSGSAVASSSVTTDSGGSTPVTLVWLGPLNKITTAEGTIYRLRDYKYEIWVDLNGNSQRDNDDVFNTFTVKYPESHHNSASQFVVPEPGTILLMMAMFGAFAIAYFIRKRIH
jgi:hypothetical protein